MKLRGCYHPTFQIFCIIFQSIMIVGQQDSDKMAVDTKESSFNKFTPGSERWENITDIRFQIVIWK